MPITSWREFWNKPNKAYVNARHTAQHYKALARDVIMTGGPGAGRTLLDFGCGEASGTPAFVAAGYNILLYEQSTHYRELARQRFGQLPGVSVLADNGLDTLEASSVDTILVCSVLQYVPKSDLPRLVDQWHAMLKPGGLLIVADITTPRSRPVTDALSLLWTGARSGYFFNGLTSLISLLISDYQKTRQSLPLSVYSSGEVLELLSPGFKTAVVPKNFGVNAFRTTILGYKKGGPP